MMGGTDNPLLASLPDPAWLLPLADLDDPGAPFGAILLDLQVAADALQQEMIQTLCDAVPSRLHLSIIESALTAPEMAAHLRQFTKILFEDRQTFFLRFTDCRVLLVLSTVLSPGQWRALTAPMTKWEIHLRDGSRHALPLGDESAQATMAPWIMRDAQLAACLDAEEADILLSQLGYTLDSMQGDIHNYWNTANRCVCAWRKDGSGNRQLLFNVARGVFQPDGQTLQEKDLKAMFVAANSPDFFDRTAGNVPLKDNAR